MPWWGRGYINGGTVRLLHCIISLTCYHCITSSREVRAISVISRQQAIRSARVFQWRVDINSIVNIFCLGPDPGIDRIYISLLAGSP